MSALGLSDEIRRSPAGADVTRAADWARTWDALQQPARAMQSVIDALRRPALTALSDSLRALDTSAMDAAREQLRAAALIPPLDLPAAAAGAQRLIDELDRSAREMRAALLAAGPPLGAAREAYTALRAELLAMEQAEPVEHAASHTLTPAQIGPFQPPGNPGVTSGAAMAAGQRPVSACPVDRDRRLSAGPAIRR